ncbi:Crp/Fnr family transcriptional regulator [Kordiimonas lipolytica]|uniref:Crp/Fnr family transcriptional regulator n=1 Tax=Kordiimonas lipolytica TaxID=1662421 RepID=A0ABV8UEH0_9PROT|nr:Crp/Fnr family transcriptional regulator [Kordiimonas lipolytica]
MSFIFNFGIPGLMEVLPPEMRARFDAIGAVKRYHHKQHIQSRGDRTAGFSVIKSGSVVFGKSDREGRFITTAVLEAGQCYGEFTVFGGLPRTHDGYAEGETVISHLSKAQFDQLLLDEPTLAAPIISLLTVRLHHMLEWVDDLRRYPLKYRLGKALLSMVKGSGDAFIAATQSALADLMGVSRVAVAQVLADYKALGFVATEYGGVRVLDRGGLRAWLQGFETIDPVVPTTPLFTDAAL